MFQRGTTELPRVAEAAVPHRVAPGGLLARLGRFCYRRRRLIVFGVWLPALLVVNSISGFMRNNFHTDFSLPDSDSKVVHDVLVRTGSDAAAGSTAQIVFRHPAFLDAAAADHVRTLMETFFARVDALEGVDVVSPYSDDGADFTDRTGAIAFAQITYTKRGQAATLALADQIEQLGATLVPAAERGLPCTPNSSHSRCTLDIEYGGQLFAGFELGKSETLGVLAAIVILLVAFGSVLAMGLPIGTALFGLSVGAGLMGIASNGFTIPEFGPEVAAMIGLGVGIDYALFIVTRFREHLHAGMDPEEAVVLAVDTSGRAVLVAGSTVILSLLGLCIVALSFVRGLAVVAALSVFIMLLASVTLLPALLGFAGARIDQTSRAAAIAVGAFVLLALVGVFTGVSLLLALLGAVVVAVLLMVASRFPFAKSLRVPLPHRRERPAEEKAWYRWSRFVQHRPWPSVLIGTAVLLALAAPMVSIRLGFGDTSNLSRDNTARRAYDLMAEGFGPGSSGPLFLVSTDPAISFAAVRRVNEALAADDDIAFAIPGKVRSRGVWFWQAFPKSSAQDEATTVLVNRLRHSTLPASGIDVRVGGPTAAGIDFAAYLGARLPLLIGAVLVLSFILLMCVFRSVLVPLKAVVMNMLSVGAAYGVIVAVFQWGWAKGLFGVGKAGPVEAWAPMMLFAIMFGLSMDYEVFLLSRMKEHFDRTGNNTQAVADGLAVTARVITAAALIMVCVFSAFVLGDSRELKVFGLGLATAVLVDATIVRMVLVPATMELLGDRNWWLPHGLDRVLPRIDVEGPRTAQ
ncbi:MAG: hypothetical protein RJA49_2374 [Actinomycetota bacterium]